MELTHQRQSLKGNHNLEHFEIFYQKHIDNMAELILIWVKYAIGSAALILHHWFLWHAGMTRD